ncbi:MAG: DM13 domain-containing protein [Dehalococcoidia bacterium]|nr:DM13 domain-containing protein [Dehalococcoidia bacterium]
MFIFGELGRIEEFVSDLYPYRWPITAGLAIAFVAFLVFAYRMHWHLAVWRHKLPSAIIAIVFVTVAVPAGNYLISPLFERTTVCEASPIPGAGAGSERCEGVAMAMESSTLAPTAAPSPAATARATPAPTPTPFQPLVAQLGEFHGADDFHFGRGKALLIETAPGQYTLRFEEFSVRNGPDLFVYLSTAADGLGEGSLNLGDLKGTDGAFNYEVPPGTDLSQFRSAIIWCRQFAVLFARAPFGPA